MGKGNSTIEVGADGVAVITIVNPPVNSLSIDGNPASSIPMFARDLSLVFAINLFSRIEFLKLLNEFRGLVYCFGHIIFHYSKVGLDALLWLY